MNHIKLSDNIEIDKLELELRELYLFDKALNDQVPLNKREELEESKSEEIFHFESKKIHKRNKFCNYCKKQGHTKDKCWNISKNRYNNKYNNNNNKYQNRKYKDNEISNYTKINDDNIFISNEFTYNEDIYNVSHNDHWIVDSGATSHICNDISKFTYLNNNIPNKTIQIADGNQITASGIGDIEIHVTKIDNTITNVKFTNVVYVPELKTNLLSVKKIV